ncbi:MAG: Type 4 pili biogenesis protein pilB (nuleotide-binding protein), partial [Betaproteobacteria bacterium]|nr:Type 4 pili biogenesis protein pilB (nuleotide-binding protein) [Candidatus Fonsibacter lacus]
LIVAQRLLRKLCPHCREPLARPDTPPTSWQAVGCARCHQGYRGRVGVFQVMPVTDAVEQAVLRTATARELRAIAQQQGIATLREQALVAVRQGLTSLDEALLHTPTDDQV